MSDDLQKKGPQDGSRINVNEPWELRYWTQKFNVTEGVLRSAVLAVGVHVKDVAAYLGKGTGPQGA